MDPVDPLRFMMCVSLSPDEQMRARTRQLLPLHRVSRRDESRAPARHANHQSAASQRMRLRAATLPFRLSLSLTLSVVSNIVSMPSEGIVECDVSVRSERNVECESSAGPPRRTASGSPAPSPLPGPATTAHKRPSTAAVLHRHPRQPATGRFG
jgi:hypothetical protein